MTERITIPKPEIHTGPKHLTVDEATVQYLREAAQRVRARQIWGSGVSALVSTVLNDVAEAVNGAKPSASLDFARYFVDDNSHGARSLWQRTDDPDRPREIAILLEEEARVFDALVTHLAAVTAERDRLRDEVTGHRAMRWPEEAHRLQRWKAEAMPVLDGLQELGRALDLPPGERVTGTRALAAVTALRDRVAALRVELDEARSGSDHDGCKPALFDRMLNDIVERAEAAEARGAVIEKALREAIDELIECRSFISVETRHYPTVEAINKKVDSFRAALAPVTTPATEAGEADE